MEHSKNKASQSYGACKKQNRKCDKLLHECGRCLRTSRSCDYDDTPKPPPTAADLENLQERLMELANRLKDVSEAGSSSDTVGTSSPGTLATESSTPSRGPKTI